MIEKNGLRLFTIKSKAEIISFDGSLPTFFSKYFAADGYIVAYLDYAVITGRYENNKLTLSDGNEFDEKYLKGLRLFNKHKELYIWREGEKLKARVRIDGEGEDTDIVEARQVLWGTNAEDLGNGFTKLYEDRGVELVIPLTNIKCDAKKKRVFLLTRNYIGYSEKTFQAGYVDCRFVDFVTSDQEG